MRIDGYDRRILEVLQQDGRISNQDLAERIGSKNFLAASLIQTIWPTWTPRVKAQKSASTTEKWIIPRKQDLW